MSQSTPSGVEFDVSALIAPHNPIPNLASMRAFSSDAVAAPVQLEACIHEYACNHRAKSISHENKQLLREICLGIAHVSLWHLSPACLTVGQVS